MEKIVCSAIWLDNSTKYSHQPKNIESGYVVCGLRHHNCLQTISLIPNTKEVRKVQGFLTSFNRFVDRKEAKTIYNTYSTVKKDSDLLYSEDLY